jgi:4-aminobutyrate aminotransferase-like enzyme
VGAIEPVCCWAQFRDTLLHLPYTTLSFGPCSSSVLHSWISMASVAHITGPAPCSTATVLTKGVFPAERASDAHTAENESKDSSSLFHFGMDFLPETIVRADGSYIYTSAGFRMLDWTSGQMSCILGHGHPDIVRTISMHASSLDHLHSSMLSPPVIQLAERLTSLLPPGLDKAFFLSTGSESNEAAIRIAKVFTKKFEIVGLGASWHGMTGAAVSAQYHGDRSGFGPLVSVEVPAPRYFRRHYKRKIFVNVLRVTNVCCRCRVT